jgi:predicted lysophospholipase L1 biosynthesis ABC-type transport system permease subunit
MNKKYIIHWRSHLNGRAGKGTKTFTLEEAEALVAELNQEYPAIEHLAVEAAETQTADVEQPIEQAMAA